MSQILENLLSSGLAKQIRQDSKKIVELNKVINANYKHRNAVWSEACAKFHKAIEQCFFPNGEEHWLDFLNGSPVAIDSALTYLAVNPRHYRSGYMAEIIWQKIKRHPLSELQKEQVEAVVISYLKHPISRQFWKMAQYVRMHGSVAYWEKVEHLAQHATGLIRERAKWVLLANQNINAKRPLHNLPPRSSKAHLSGIIDA